MIEDVKFSIDFQANGVMIIFIRRFFFLYLNDSLVSIGICVTRWL